MSTYKWIVEVDISQTKRGLADGDTTDTLNVTAATKEEATDRARQFLKNMHGARILRCYMKSGRNKNAYRA